VNIVSNAPISFSATDMEYVKSLTLQRFNGLSLGAFMAFNILGVNQMIITVPGTYEIVPQTAVNDNGIPYQVRNLEVIAVDKANQKVLTAEFGWIGWDIALKGEKRH
jgi:hypothetical protein